MSAAIYPLDAMDKTVTWSVSDTNLASIDTAGLLTAKQDGTITIKAVADGEKVYTKKLIKS